jgi:hypothetical protein
VPVLAPSLLLPVLLADSPSVTPVGTVTSDLVSYILGYGVVGIVALAFAFRFIVPASVVKEAREQARADIKAELERVLAEKRAVEEQRDEALRVARDQFVPILTSFTASASSLIPLLQELVSRREREGSRDRYPRDGG